jgi:hypothetical protein
MVALSDAPAWVDDALPDIRAVTMVSMRSSAHTSTAPSQRSIQLPGMPSRRPTPGRHWHDGVPGSRLDG